VDGQEVVDVRQDRSHAPDSRLVPALSETRVEPNQTVAATSKGPHLSGELFDIPRFAAVGDNHHHGATAKHLWAPLFAERMQALRDAGASGEVGHLAGHCIEGDIDVSKPKGVRHAGQARAENECFRPTELLTQPVKELQDDSAVELHRAADVRDEDERARLVLALSVPKLDDDATQFGGPSQGFAVVQHAATPALDEPMAEAPTEVPAETGHGLPEFPELIFGQLREVFAPQPFDIGRGLGTIGDFDLLALPLGFLRHERHQAWSLKLFRPVTWSLRRFLWTRAGASRLPELDEGSVEEVQILLAIDQGRASSVIHLAATEWLYPSKRFCEANSLVDTDGKAEKPELLDEFD
jgi:hypothetical protein